jgi:hypothetical protein
MLLIQRHRETRDIIKSATFCSATEAFEQDTTGTHVALDEGMDITSYRDLHAWQLGMDLGGGVSAHA